MAVLACACTRESPRFHVSTRLIEHLPERFQGFTSSDCAIADQHRPSIGCTEWRRIGIGKVAEAGVLPDVNLNLTPDEHRRPIFLKGYRQRLDSGTDVVRLPQPRIV